MHEGLDYVARSSRQRFNRASQVPGNAGMIKVDYGLLTLLKPDGLRRYGG